MNESTFSMHNKRKCCDKQKGIKENKLRRKNLERKNFKIKQD